MRIILFFFGMGPKPVSHTETSTGLRVLENRVMREYMEIRSKK
jgi:hypothetical protein